MCIGPVSNGDSVNGGQEKSEQKPKPSANNVLMYSIIEFVDWSAAR